jgi:hypothetical protein
VNFFLSFYKRKGVVSYQHVIFSSLLHSISSVLPDPEYGYRNQAAVAIFGFVLVDGHVLESAGSKQDTSLT